MKTKLKVTVLVLLFFTVQLLSQQITINGYIQNIQTGERLQYANIFEPNMRLGTTSNNYGFYSLTLPQTQDSISIIISYVGYGTEKRKILLTEDKWLTINLTPTTLISEEVKVVATGYDAIEEKSQMSQIDIPIKQIETLPTFFGETDVLKTIQLLPGVQSGSEGNSGLYVRGGSPEQNLILLDGTPVYNANHLFGFFSVFNSDAIKNINLTKGGFPARYGGRLSSVLEINLKEGNNQEYKGQATIGLISSKFTLEGPIIKGKTSFVVSARRTYFDVLARPFMPDNSTGGYYFYDINAKVNHTFSKDDKIFLSVYTGDDQFYADDESSYSNYSSTNSFSLGWGNITSTFRWNHLFSPKLFSNVNLTYSNFNFYVDIENSSQTDNVYSESYKIGYSSGIRDFSGSIDFDYLPNPNHYIKFGGKVISHKFNPGVFQYNLSGSDITSIDTTISPNILHNSIEANLYIEDDYKLTDNLKANIGIHSSLFSVKDKFFYSIEPRISMRYLIEGWALKTSYAFMTQYIHLLSNSGIGLPTDLWVPTTKKIKPQKGHQAALGVARTINFYDDFYELSFEGYYKTMDGLIEYQEGADFIGADTDWQDKVEIGSGRSYGVELFVQKKSGATTGWLGYTLSWTDRHFDNLNNGNRFPFKYDRRHDISIAVSHAISESFDVSLVWVYGTGNAITMGSAKYRGFNSNWSFTGYSNLYDGFIYYEKRNGFRMEEYHRLDLSASFKWGDENQHKLTLGVYNMYSRKNPFFYYFDYDYESNKEVMKKVSLFPILPAISYSYKF
ncbi:MAG: TonB-dependent receptor plug domain-containing protein [Bacteroidota bacterium]